ncbi:FAD-dependent oxidoreductase, partial [Desulfovibrio sp. OttesenSCG-928-O18]|nr:FAD-dependent oxidoreductase [Desulfovibrio sp. OttesenSCG-928-O18]
MTKQYDVIILGGGTSGTIAAIAAARNGAKTLVVERYGNLGGTAVFGIPFLGMYDGRDERVNAGIPQEFVERMKKEGGALEGCFGGTWMDEQYRFSITPFEQETYKYVAQEMLLEAGAEILFHSFVSDLTLKDGNIESVEIVNKSGKTRYGAKVFIDCTGDGDIAFRAGAPFMEKTAVQNASILFKMGGVNMHRFYDALQKSEGVTGWGEWHNRVIIGKKLDTDEPGPIHLAGHFTGENGKEITFTAISIISTEVYINASRTINVDATSAEDLSRAEISERRNVWNVTRVMMANVPGFEHSHLIYSSPVGIRESRNIRGEYVLQQE